jgi:hypothetical protein|uniref:Uncharacterized protein n=1 Tax=Picea glauca TaxID=3330 RepID=A0A101LYV7_PICGL|nr:hypothetical protein ABT39_MTgene4871 [Picea glauca]QHR92363.1 hypothetical protein Q903MT_gene6406 [Picea sitchensis]
MLRLTLLTYSFSGWPLPVLRGKAKEQPIAELCCRGKIAGEGNGKSPALDLFPSKTELVFVPVAGKANQIVELSGLPDLTELWTGRLA